MDVWFHRMGEAAIKVDGSTLLHRTTGAAISYDVELGEIRGRFTCRADEVPPSGLAYLYMGDGMYRIAQRTTESARNIECEFCRTILRASGLVGHRGTAKCQASQAAAKVAAAGWGRVWDGDSRLLMAEGFTDAPFCELFKTRLSPARPGKSAHLGNEFWWRRGLVRIVKWEDFTRTAKRRWLADAFADPRWVELWDGMTDEEFARWACEVWEPDASEDFQHVREVAT